MIQTIFYRAYFYLVFMIFLSFISREIHGNERFEEIQKYDLKARVCSVADGDKNGSIFYSCLDHTIYCIDAQGKCIWSFQAESKIYGIAYDPEKRLVFFGSSDHTLYCVNEDKQIVWSFPTRGEAYRVAYDRKNGRILCSCSANYFYCLYTSGTLLYSFAASETVHDMTYDPEEERIFYNSDKSVHCLSYSGEPIYSFPIEKNIYNICYDYDSRELLSISSEGYFYIFDPKGELLFEKWLGSLREGTYLGANFKKKHAFVPCDQGIRVIRYGYQTPPLGEARTLPLPGRITLKPLYEQAKHPTFVLEVCSLHLPSTKQIAAASGKIYSVEKQKLWDETFSQIVHCTNLHMEKEKIGEIFSGDISRVNPLVVGQKGDFYYVNLDGQICRFVDRVSSTVFEEKGCFSPTVGQNGKLYFSSEEGEFFSVDPETKDIVWHVTANPPPLCSLALSCD